MEFEKKDKISKKEVINCIDNVYKQYLTAVEEGQLSSDDLVVCIKEFESEVIEKFSSLYNRIKDIEDILISKEFTKNTLHKRGFKCDLIDNYDEKIKSESVQIFSILKGHFDRQLLQRYPEKYCILDYYMICYLTEERPELFDEYVRYLNYDEVETKKEDTFDKSKYVNEMHDFLTGVRFTEEPYFLTYALNKEVDYDKTELTKQQLLDKYYDEATEAFYSQYPEVKEYAEKHPVDFSGPRHKSDIEKTKEAFLKFKKEE